MPATVTKRRHGATGCCAPRPARPRSCRPFTDSPANGQQIHDDICNRGFDRERGCFVQAYGSKDVDASLLLMPSTGFLPASDPRVKNTVEAIERDLVRDGFVMRYDTADANDGLPPG